MKKKAVAILIVLATTLSLALGLTACSDVQPEGRIYECTKVGGVFGDFDDFEKEMIEELYVGSELLFEEGKLYLDDVFLGEYTVSGKEFEVKSEEGGTITGSFDDKTLNLMMVSGKRGFSLQFELIYAPEPQPSDPSDPSDPSKPSVPGGGIGLVTAKNAYEKTAENWDKYSNKSAVTTVTISGAEIAIGVNGDKKAVVFSFDAHVELIRTWKNGILTIDITAKPTEVELKLNSFLEGIAGGIISQYFNVDEFTGLELKAQIYYEYGTYDKYIGVRDMSISGLRSAIPALTDENITNEPYEIKFNVGEEYVTEVSYPLAEFDEAIQNGEVGTYLEMLFNEDYTFDPVGIFEDMLLGQTALDFGDPTNATFGSGRYSNSVSALDNLNFLMNVWDNINEDGMNVLNTFISPDMEIYVGEDVLLPIGQILGVFLDDSEFTNLLPNLLENLITRKGTMRVDGTIANGIFTSLNMNIQNAEIDLSRDQVNSIADIVLGMLEGIIDFGAFNANELVEQIAGGDAYIDFGKITVNSTFTVA